MPFSAHWPRLTPQRLLGVGVAGLFLFGSLLMGGQTTSGSSASVARIEFELPPGARLLVNGKDRSQERVFEDRDCPEGQLGKADLEIKLPDGTFRQRTILYQKGWFIRVAEGGKLVRPEIVPQTGHADPINSLQFSPDGLHLLTGSGDRSAILWDVATGRKLRTYQGEHSNFVTWVRFSPDSQHVLTGSLDKTVVIWERVSGKKVRTLGPHPSEVTAFAVSRDGKLVAVGQKNGQIRLWEFEGKPVGEGEWTAHGGLITSLTFSRTGKYLLSSSTDKTAVLWLTGNRSKVGTFTHEVEVAWAALSEDGRHLATASLDGQATIWNPATRKKLHTLTGHRAGVKAVAFSPNGKYVATAALDRTIMIWSADRGERLRTLMGHDDKVLCLDWGHDGRLLASGSWDTTAIIWNVTAGTRQHVLGKVGDRPWALTISQDGQKFFMGSGDRTGVVWEPAMRQLTALRGHRGRFIWAEFDMQGQRLLTASDDHSAILWDLKTAKPQLRLEGHKDWVMAATFTPGGQQALTCSRDGTAILWDLQTGKPKRRLEPGLGPIWEIRAHPKGGRAVTVHQDKTIVLWDLQTGLKLRTFTGHQGAVVAAAFTPNGQQMATASLDKTVILWDVEKGKIIRRLAGHTQGLSTVHFLAGGKQLISCSFDGTIRWWDAASGRTLRILKGHSGPVDVLAPHPNGRHVLSAAGDGTCRMWDLATGDTVMMLTTLRDGRDWLAVTPEGLFDGSRGGWQNVNLRLGDGLQVVPVGRFFQDFYSFGLLESVWQGHRPLPRAVLGKSQPPRVRLVKPEANMVVPTAETLIEVEIIDQGGGINGPHLYHQGVKVAGEWEVLEQTGGKVRQRRKLILVEGQNRISVRAASKDRAVESEPATVLVECKKQLPKGKLHVVAVGVSQYAEPVLNLKFAAKDARALADLFQRRGKALYDDVQVHLLIDREATADAIRRQLRQVAESAREPDALVLLLAGHGVTLGREYYFLPHDFRRPADSRVEEAVKKSGLPASTLGADISAIRALRRVIILDTCQSGQAGSVLARQRFDYENALKRLHHQEGGYLIAAASATEEAKEHDQLGHGVLTYTLLAGLGGVKHGQLKDRPIILPPPRIAPTVLEWFSYAGVHVPALMEDLFRMRSRPQIDATGEIFEVLPLKGG